MKVVINACFGGFSLSESAYNELGIPWDGYGFLYDEERTSERLVSVVEKLGHEASGSCANLKVVEIPDDVEYTIEEYDGLEHVSEAHRTWS